MSAPWNVRWQVFRQSRANVAGFLEGEQMETLMKRSFRMRLASLVVGCAVMGGAVSGAQNHEDEGWDRAAAIGYLDARLTWWMDWETAARDHGTFCVSCHTVLPYALGRTMLRETAAPGAIESRLFKNVERRVMAWDQILPFYSDEQFRVGKTAESRGTEAILNALILTNRDSREGLLSDTTLRALDNLWALQTTSGSGKGAWPWLDFGLEPWETSAAGYYGAALAGVAVGHVPDDYDTSPVNRARVAELRRYLQREVDNQNLFNRLTALWASTSMSGVFTLGQQLAIKDETLSLQREDGGWSLASLGLFERLDGTPVESESDGYATGLVLHVFQEAGLAVDDHSLSKGLAWLRTNQSNDGSWPASSLNRARDPMSDRGRFMRDAATAYAVLALTGSE